MQLVRRAGDKVPIAKNASQLASGDELVWFKEKATVPIAALHPVSKKRRT